MMVDRRSFIFALAGAGGVMACRPLVRGEGQSAMYGLIGKMKAAPGKRDELSAILLEGLRDMPGNLSYVVARDPEEPDTIWITEVWTDVAAHEASLSMPSVQKAISKGRPLIADMERVAETEPIGGHGL